MYFDDSVQRDDPDPDVRRLARLIGRTPEAVAYKMHNIEAIDPSVRKKGLEHGGKLDKETFEAFVGRTKDLRTIVKEIRERYERHLPPTAEELVDDIAQIRAGSYHVDDEISEGKRRKKQDAFRSLVLENYGYSCCMCDVDVPALLTAAHIKPWAKDPDHRLDPHNGLCLCSLHDRAFDRGLISINDRGKVMVWRGIASSISRVVTEQLRNLEGGTVRSPMRDPPAEKFLKYHRNIIFGKAKRINA